MTNFYNANYIDGNGGTLTQGQYKTAIEANRSIMYELPGGGPENALTLSSYTITPANTTGPVKVVDTQGGAANDDLKTITPTNCRDGHILIIRSASALRVPRIFNAVGGTGQILTADGAHISLTDPKQFVMLKYKASTTSWEEIFRSQNIDLLPTATISANYVFSGPPSGGAAKPSWRLAVEADLPAAINRLPGKGAATAITLASDAFTPSSTTGFMHVLTSETGTSDDLKFIVDTNLTSGQFLLIRPASGHAITVRHNASGATGSQRVIKLRNGADRVLQGDMSLLIYYEASQLVEWTAQDADSNTNLSRARYVLHQTDVSNYGSTSISASSNRALLTPTANSTANNDQASSPELGGGTFIKYGTSAVNTNVAKLIGPNACGRGEVGGMYFFRYRTDATITSMRQWLGVLASTLETLDTSNSVQALAFRYSTAASDANWQCYSCSGSGAPTVTNSGIAVQANTTYEFVIDQRNPNLIRFYINGKLVAEHTTGIPTGSNLFGHITLTTLSAASRFFNFSRFAVEAP